MMSASCSFLKLLEGFDKGLNCRLIHLDNDKASWQIYFDKDCLIYATSSLQSFERLERHLKRISRGNYEGVQPLKPWMRSQLESFYDLENKSNLAPDYQSINWLVSQGIISSEIASLLVKWISLEVLETALLWNDRSWKYRIESLNFTESFPSFERLKVPEILDQLYERLSSWQTMGSVINSPYQRPYFSSNQQAMRRISSETMKKLTRLLKGFNFRQLSALLNQDELALAQRLAPLVADGIIVLRDPEPPFDDLPYVCNLAHLFPNVPFSGKFSGKTVISSRSKPKLLDQANLTAPAPNLAIQPLDSPSGELRGLMSNVKPSQVWKVVCVDDSKAMLQEISRLLDSESLEITTISDPTKALMQICTIIPDIVLLDVGMPNIDGYQICQLIRKVPRLKDIPIVMVTGNKGLVDRAKARFAGATDYLTKPFDHQELIAMVFRYLS